MAGFKLTLLGGFELSDAHGRSCPLRSKKAMALLAYLVLSPGSQRRERVASLLWPDSDEAQARHSLRQVLVSLRKVLGETALLNDSEHLQLAPGIIDSDIERFGRLVGERDSDAAALCGGELLDGFQSRSYPFEEWLQLQREHFRRQALELLQQLLDDCLNRNAFSEAARLGAQLLMLDPLREDVHRQLMELYGRLGQYNHAFRQYQLCRSLLRRELDMEPDQNTQNLYRLLQHRREQLNREPASVVPATTEAGPKTDDSESKALALLLLQLGDDLVLDSQHSRALTEQCRNHGGTLLESGQGDLRLLIFGLPQVRADDCDRALQCALQLLEWADEQGLTLTAGLCHGPLRLIQNPPGSATGPALQDARRLVLLADAPGLWLGESVYRAFQPRLKAQPGASGTGWRVTGHLRMASTRAPFVGRGLELQQLDLYLQAVCEAGCAHVVYIRGDAGIGKSRLLEQLCLRANASGFRHLATEVLPLAQHSDHYPLQRLVRGMLEQLLGYRIEAQTLGPALDEYRQRFGPLPGLPELAGHVQDEADAGQLPQQAVLETLLAQLSPGTPLLITVEDIHWADPATVTALTALARAGADSPVLLVMTSRFEGHPFSPQWRSSLGELPLLTLDLAPLRPDDSRRLIRALGHDPDSPSAQCCQQRAEGNPLFLEQLLCFDSDRASQQLPLRIASLVAARVDALEAPARRLIRLAAVLGQQFEQRDLLALGDAEPNLVELLIQQRLLRLRDGQLAFAHALLQESLYAQLDHRERLQAHLRAAQFYAGRSLVREAEHLLHAGEPKAATRAREAAQLLLERQQPQRTLWFCERALALAATDECWSLHQLKGEALIRLGRIDDAITAFDQAISLSDLPERQVDSWLGIAGAQTIQDQFDDALQSLDHAARLSATLSCSQRARLHITRSSILFTLGQQQGCIEAGRQALEAAASCDDPRWQVRALSSIGDGYYLQGHMKQAEEYFQQAVATALEHDQLPEAVNNYAMVATCQLYQLDTSGAQRSLDSADRFARRRPEPRSRMLLLNVQGLLHYFARGDTEAATDCFSTSLRLAQQLDSRRFITDCNTQLAYMALQRGDQTGFERYILAANASLEAGARHFILPWLRAVEATGQADAASRQRQMTQALQLLTPACLPHCQVHAHQLQIDLALRDRNFEMLRSACDSLRAYARERDMPLAEFYADRALALAQGHGDRLEPELKQLGLLHCLHWFDH
ncbi:MAG: AAA family ATPase [Oceanospirillaceae bacterium]|nr:AAA family ATPase [Oceanospirillaceae bacterium]